MATGVPTQWSARARPPRRRAHRLLAAAGRAASAAPPSRPSSSARCARRSAARSSPATRAPRPASPRARSSDDDDEVVATTVGRPAPEVELRDRRRRDGREQLPTARSARCVCRSPAMMRGYWQRPRAHRRGRRRATAGCTPAISGSSAPTATCASSAGSRRCTSAAATTCTRPRSRRCSPTIPSVARAAVVGAPDPVLGEIGVAFVVPAADAPRARRSTTLRAWCRDRIADYKAPDRVVVVDELPRHLDAEDRQARAGRAQTTEGDRTSMTIQEVGTGDTHARSRSSSAARCSRWSSRTRATRSRTTAGTSATTSTPAA